MSRVRVHNFAISLDGFCAGPNQDLENPIGVGGPQLHNWIFETRAGRSMTGRSGGTEGIDNTLFGRREEGIGATIMGRNMFGPERGAWSDDPWRGWWGEVPPFHHDVFVLTHYGRDPLEMAGGTTFYFVDGVDDALELAFNAAGGRDVLVGGGATTLRQFLNRGLVDDMHIAVVPVLLGDGERLFADGDTMSEIYECVERVVSPAVTHFNLAKKVSLR